MYLRYSLICTIAAAYWLIGYRVVFTLYGFALFLAQLSSLRQDSAPIISQIPPFLLPSYRSTVYIIILVSNAIDIHIRLAS